MSSANQLAIGEITVRQHGELFSLNDLHRASGGEKRHQPSDFLKIAQTKALVAEIGNSEDSRSLITKEGRNGGTYACRELVIAYAAWISAAFHLKVIRVFLAATAPAQAALPAPIQQQELTLDYEGRRLRIVHLDGAPWLVAADLALALGLRNSYVILRRLPNEQQRKILFGNQQVNIINLDGMRRTLLAAAPERARAFGQWLEQALELQQAPAVPAPQVDPGSLLRGMLAGNRFMCLLDSAGRITLREIPEDHMTIAMDQVPNWVADPCGARPELLPRILQAVSQRMGAKV